MLSINKELNRIEVDDIDEFNEYYEELSDEYNDYTELYELLEEYWANGVMYVLSADDVGALTDDTNFIFSTDFEFEMDNEFDEYVVIYNYYHVPDYMIMNYIGRLKDRGYIQLEKFLEPQGIKIKL
jgi:hypothetical protein